MTRFAFVVHPISIRDVARRYPVAKYVPGWLVEQIIKRKKPVLCSKIEGIRSITGATTEGWFIGCPLTPKQMMELPLPFVYRRIVQCTELAASLGADLIGLGAFTSVVGDGGVTVAKESPIPVTTGNSYTVATAIEGTLRACLAVGVDPENSTLAVVGATGSIGKTCAEVLSKRFRRTLLVGRNRDKVEALAAELSRKLAPEPESRLVPLTPSPNPSTRHPESDAGRPVASVAATTDMADLMEADAVITVTSSEVDVVMPEHLKAGCVVCDVARPRDVSIRVARERPDVLVIEGGVVRVPGEVEFNFNFGFPPKTAYACMSETMMLALDGRAESFTLGKDVSVAQVEETMRLADKHGFELAGFRSFERAIDEAAIERARKARGL